MGLHSVHKKVPQQIYRNAKAIREGITWAIFLCSKKICGYVIVLYRLPGCYVNCNNLELISIINMKVC